MTLRSIRRLHEEFERLQNIMQELKKENYELKVRLQESGNLTDKVLLFGVRIAF